ncbi:MAG: FAD-dependent oxidoreductase [bacterium]
MDEWEIIVLGSGAAGLTAGLFAARNGRSTLVLTDGAIGGQLLSVGNIEDFPGFPDGVPGYELGPLIQEQAEKAGAGFRTTVARGLKPAGDRWLVATGEGELRAAAVIVATGSRFRSLGVPGEERLRGRGVSNCATCDAPLIRGETVGVVGGGDSALLEALELAQHAGKVFIFHRDGAFAAQHTYRQRVLAHPAMEVRHWTVIEEIIGENSVEAVTLRETRTGAVAQIELAAVFVYVGMEPQTAFLRGRLQLDESGRIVTDGSLRTELAGVFAAGHVRSGSEPQAAVAAGEGARAALAAHSYLENRQVLSTSDPAPYRPGTGAQ